MSDLRLSGKELEFLGNQAIFPLKKQITGKIIAVYAAIEQDLRQEIGQNPFSFPELTLKRTGKVSKGENYRGQPYIVLDFPRLLQKDTIFLFRNVCLWGHYFIHVFILTGSLLETYRYSLTRNIEKIRQKDLLINTNDDPWELVIGTSKLVPARQVSEKKMAALIEKSPHITLGSALSFTQFDKLKENSLNFFGNILDLLV